MISPNTNPKKNIYLADDDDDDRSMFAEALFEIDSSIQLTQVEDGKKLMDILYISPDKLPDVIVLDINMPRKNGFECLEEIRGHNGHLKDLSIIMFSTSNDPNTIAKAYELGATFYAIKPNSFKDLKLLISNILQINWLSPEMNNMRFQLL